MRHLFQSLWHISLHWTFFESLAIWITAVSKSLNTVWSATSCLLSFVNNIFSSNLSREINVYKQLTYFVTSSTNYTEEEDLYVSHVRSHFTYYSTIQRPHLIKRYHHQRYHHDWVNLWLSKVSNEQDLS